MLSCNTKNCAIASTNYCAVLFPSILLFFSKPYTFHIIGNFLRSSVKKIGLAALSARFPLLTEFLHGLLHFFFQPLCGNPVCTLSENNNLFQTVGSGNRYLILPSDSVNRFFNILIGSFRFLCVNHMNVVIPDHLFRMALHFVSIKNENQRTLFVPLII